MVLQASNPQFFCDYHTIITGSDPAAVDRIGFDVVIAGRIAEGLQEKHPRRRDWNSCRRRSCHWVLPTGEKIELREVYWDKSSGINGNTGIKGDTGWKVRPDKIVIPG
ncbi:MAG: hypothetical protein IPI37_00260 [Bacteroidales bacterium]|nr:hypothetical protein [Bacteroidales bacterium]